VADCGHALEPNAEQHLRSRAAGVAVPARMAGWPRWNWPAAASFSLDELRYEYPEEIVPAGHTPASWLRQLTEEGARRYFPQACRRPCARCIEHELALIAQLQYEPYFLTVADLVHWARSQGILCQGRGSAANSAVCYCLGVTEVDPAAPPCCSSVSSAPNATSRPTSTSTSSTSAAKRSSSTSTASTAATARR
jgi:error-prone DNA polymerase